MDTAALNRTVPSIFLPQNMPEAYSFDKDDESDRELLRHDPYAEYIDFPEEYRVKDEAQMELVCC